MTQYGDKHPTIAAFMWLAGFLLVCGALGLWGHLSGSDKPSTSTSYTDDNCSRMGKYEIGDC